MTSSAGPLLDLDITGIAHGGTFIARHEGRVVFVSDAIPGERVRAQVTDPSTGADDKRSFWRAETVEVLEASPHRRAHVWKEADLRAILLTGLVAPTSGTSSSHISER